jgi:molybdopterin-synthase adenylyltransferase
VSNNDRFSRQSFLGENSQDAIERALVGLVGLGGGGGHVALQLPCVGFLNYRVYDADFATESNLNRLVIADEADAAAEVPKVELARRRILAIRSKAKVETFQCRWQERPEPLRGCDIVFGCVDSFQERQELEVCCRRYLISYVDVGMDVNHAGDEPPRMSGQIILSLPGGPCMWCLGFLNEEKLAREVALYGAAGGRPQVVWPNGVLASTAVGIAVRLLTDWSRSARGPVYLSYNGNDDTVTPHVRLKYIPPGPCPHYPPDQVGEPVFVKL